MSNSNPADNRTLDSGQEEFAEILAQISTWMNESNAIQWDQIIAEHPQFADELRRVQPAFDGIMTLGCASGPSTSEPDESLDERFRATRSVGDFKIVREIGRGGMGVVYEAQQLSINRSVALKVLPLAALIDRRAMQRFKNEVSAIATLAHPNIVSVYSVGEERAIHFFAMQLVRGRSLASIIKELERQSDANQSLTGDSFSRAVVVWKEPRNAVDDGKSHQNYGASQNDNDETRARAVSSTHCVEKSYIESAVRIVIQATAALQHAHDHGVIHRDVKPGNLLLDESGTLFVTDFGLAHVETAPGVTMSGDFLGTLRYMSPEQVLANRVLVDHRTDIYSLGATLYELLTLQPMWPGDERAELIKQISFGEPVRMRKIIPSIPQDLETIVLKATRKNLEERYGSARELGEDLQRFLDCKPVIAKRPTLLQKSAKWTRRHPAIIWSAILLMLIVTFGSLFSATLIWHAQYQTNRALQDAKNRADENQAVVDYLINDLLAAATPEMALGRELTVKEVLENAERSIDSSLTDYPLVEASVREALARTYRHLAEYNSAATHANKAVAIRMRELGTNHADTMVALVEQARVLGDMGKGVECHALLMDVYDNQNRILGPEDPDTLETMTDIGKSLARQKKYEIAEEWLDKTMTIQRRVLSPDHRLTIRSMHWLGWTLMFLERFEEAKNIADEVVSWRRSRLGPTHPGTLASINLLTTVLLGLGEPEEAERIGSVNVASHEKILGLDHPSTLGAYNNHAAVLMEIRNLPKAKLHLEKHIKIHRRVTKQEPIGPRINLAIILAEMNEYHKSNQILEEIWPNAEQVLGLDHDWPMTALSRLAANYRIQGRDDDAEQVLKDGLRRRKTELDSNHPQVLRAQFELASLFRDQGKLAEAEQKYIELLELEKQVYGVDDSKTVDTMLQLARIMLQLNRPDEAMQIIREAFPLIQHQVQHQTRNQTRAIDNRKGVFWLRGTAAKKKGEYDKAIKDFTAVIEIDPKFDAAYFQRATAWSALGELDNAIEDYTLAIRLDPNDPLAYNNRGAICMQKGEYDKAIADFNEAIRLNPKYGDPYTNRAWLRATCPDAQFRDGKQAVEDAHKACDLSDWKNGNDISNLSAAYAEAGDFNEAMRWLKKAIDLTPNDAKESLNVLDEMRECFEAGKPFRD